MIGNMVYYPNYLYPLTKHYAENGGGQPRYDINNDPNFTGNNQLVFQQNTQNLRNFTQNLANKHKLLIQNYINNK